jgi:hypothetical protein
VARQKMIINGNEQATAAKRDAFTLINLSLA